MAEEKDGNALFKVVWTATDVVFGELVSAWRESGCGDKAEDYVIFEEAVVGLLARNAFMPRKVKPKPKEEEDG